MTQSPVRMLQEAATDSTRRLSDVLRVCLLIARRLGRPDFEEWATHELKGFPSAEALPAYRKVYAQIKAIAPHGLIPVLLKGEAKRVFEELPVAQNIASIEALVASGDPHCQLPLSRNEMEFLWKGADEWEKFAMVRIIPSSSMIAILDQVRTTILEWSLQLEAEGVVGEGMSFSDEEKIRADSVTINNFGVYGNVTGSTITHSFNRVDEISDVATLLDFLAKHRVNAEDREALHQAINGDPIPEMPHRFGARVEAWLTSMYVKISNGVEDLAPELTKELLVAAIMRAYDSIRS
jgi:hypothetical protein